MSRSALRPLVIVAVVAAVGLVTWWGATGLAEWASGLGGGPDATIVAGQEVVVVVPEGSTARSIAGLLEDEGVIAASEFDQAVRERSAGAQLKAGEYTLVSGSSADVIIDALVSGPVIETYRLTIPEGLRVDEILDVIVRESPIERSELESALLSGAVTSSLLQDTDEASLRDWEGLLFPDTYEFFDDATAADVLGLLADTMEQRVAAVDWSGLEEAGFTVYEGIIMASLIESEAAIDEDRPLIASVIANRMEIGMRLQIDATVLYALDRRGGAVTLDDLQVDSPWNTYRVDGLPPTPIGAPGVASLEAAADPAESDYLYYVLTSADGSHSFTVDYDEFLALKDQAKADGVIP